MRLLDKVFFNKYAIWADTAFAVSLLIKSAVMVLTGDFLPVGIAALMLICIPMLLAVTISLKGGNRRMGLETLYKATEWICGIILAILTVGTLISIIVQGEKRHE